MKKEDEVKQTFSEKKNILKRVSLTDGIVLKTDRIQKRFKMSPTGIKISTSSISSTSSNSNDGRPTSSGSIGASASISQSSDFFTQGIIRLNLSSKNKPNYSYKETPETLGKFNSLYLWDKSKSQQSGESQDTNANINYTYDSHNRFHQPEQAPLTSHHSPLYEKAVGLAQGLWDWNSNNKFTPTVWSLLMTYPSELHTISRTVLAAVVTTLVVGKTLEEFVNTVDLDGLSKKLERVLDHHLLDGTDPNDPGRIGVNKDFL